MARCTFVGWPLFGALPSGTYAEQWLEQLQHYYSHKTGVALGACIDLLGRHDCIHGVSPSRAVLAPVLSLNYRFWTPAMLLHFWALMLLNK